MSTQSGSGIKVQIWGLLTLSLITGPIDSYSVPSVHYIRCAYGLDGHSMCNLPGIPATIKKDHREYLNQNSENVSH